MTNVQKVWLKVVGYPAWAIGWGIPGFITGFRSAPDMINGISTDQPTRVGFGIILAVLVPLGALGVTLLSIEGGKSLMRALDAAGKEDKAIAEKRQREIEETLRGEGL